MSCPNPASIWRRNNVLLPSIRRHYLASTSVWRRYDVMCQLEKKILRWPSIPSRHTTIRLYFDVMCLLALMPVHPCLYLLPISFQQLCSSRSNFLHNTYIRFVKNIDLHIWCPTLHIKVFRLSDNRLAFHLFTLELTVPLHKPHNHSYRWLFEVAIPPAVVSIKNDC